MSDPWQGRTVFVTGASGLLGYAIAHTLLERGARVRALCRGAALPGDLGAMGVTVIAGDLDDRAALRRALDEAEQVFHVAADVRMKNLAGRRRLSTIAAGASFGELALVDGSTRSTRIVALEPTICYVLSPEAFDELRHRDPASAAELVMAIARSLSHRLRSSTADVAAFEDL